MIIGYFCLFLILIYALSENSRDFPTNSLECFGFYILICIRIA